MSLLMTNIIRSKAPNVSMVAHDVKKHTLKAGQGAPGVGRWLYALPTAPFTKVANGPFKWGLQHRFGLAAPGAGHLCGKQLPAPNGGARHRLIILAVMLPGEQGVPGKSDTTESGIFLCNILKATGSTATSEQAMPLPRDSQPAARETRAVHTADTHVSEPHGTDIWIDVKVRREYGLGASNLSTLFDVPVHL